jgi:hypothetical protein
MMKSKGCGRKHLRSSDTLVTKNYKISLLASPHLYICMSGGNNSRTAERIFMKFDIGKFDSNLITIRILYMKANMFLNALRTQLASNSLNIYWGKL